MAGTANDLVRPLFPLAAVVAVAVLSGCTYQSTYFPPNDGRARLVWAENEVTSFSPAMTSECLARVNGTRQLAVSPWVAPESDVDDGSPYSEQAYDYGGAPRHGWRGHRYAGRWANGGGRGHLGGSHVVGGGYPGGGHLGGSHLGGGHGGGGGKGGGGGGGKGGGGGGDIGKGALIVLVLAYVATPILSLVWATDRPESTGVAASMDAVHAYNDLVRGGEVLCGGAP